MEQAYQRQLTCIDQMMNVQIERFREININQRGQFDSLRSVLRTRATLREQNHMITYIAELKSAMVN